MLDNFYIKKTYHTIYTGLRLLLRGHPFKYKVIIMVFSAMTATSLMVIN